MADTNGVGYTPDGVQRYTTTASVDEAGNVSTVPSQDWRIDAKQIKELYQNEEYNVISGIAALRYDGELLNDLGSRRMSMFRDEINYYTSDAMAKIELGNAITGVSIATGGNLGYRAFEAMSSSSFVKTGLEYGSRARDIIRNSNLRNSFSTQIQNARSVAKATHNPWANFATNGVSPSAAESYLKSSDGMKLFDALQQGRPTATPAELQRTAMEILTSGKELPTIQKIESGHSLLKITSGNGVGPDSPYFTTPAEWAKAQASGQTIADYFALPGANESTTYKVFEITPISSAGADVFVSPIAPATDALIHRQGNGLQYIVPNRSAWTDPVLILNSIGN